MPELTPLEESVDLISKGIAASSSRRDVLKLLGGVFAGGLAGLFGSKQIEASSIDACLSCGTCKFCNVDTSVCNGNCSESCLASNLCNEANLNPGFTSLKQYLIGLGFRARSEPTAFEATGSGIAASKTLDSLFVRSRSLSFRKPHFLDEVAVLRFVKTSSNVAAYVLVNQFNKLSRVYYVDDQGNVQYFPRVGSLKASSAAAFVKSELSSRSPSLTQQSTLSSAGACNQICNFLCGQVPVPGGPVALMEPGIYVACAALTAGWGLPACILGINYLIGQFDPATQHCETVCSSSWCSCSLLDGNIACGENCCSNPNICCSDFTCKPPDQCCPRGTKSCGFQNCCADSPDIKCCPQCSGENRCVSACPSGTTNCGANCCGSGQVCTDPAAGTCGCVPNQESCGPFCCPPGKICVDATLGACGCPVTQAMCGDTCCPDGQYCNSGACVTSCPPGKVVCQQQCYDACPGGQYHTRDPQTCQCQCPGNVQLCNGRCCQANSYCHSNGNCYYTCPAGSQNCDNTRQCVPTCQQPFPHYDAETCQCTCNGSFCADIPICLSSQYICCPAVPGGPGGHYCQQGQCCVRGNGQSYYCCPTDRTCCTAPGGDARCCTNDTTCCMGSYTSICVSAGYRCCTNLPTPWQYPENKTCGSTYLSCV